MPLPTKAKTWQINYNNRVLAATPKTNRQNLLLGIKNALTGFASGALTVVACCDSTVVADYWDGVDRWDVGTDLVWAAAGNPHSWIVLERTDGAQICIALDLASSSGEKGSVVLSPGGLFSGGSDIARPTATDQCTDIIISHVGGSSDHWGGYYYESGNGDIRFHVWNSTDGLIQRVAIFRRGYNVCFWRFEVFRDPPTGLTKPIFASIRVEDVSTLVDVTTPNNIQADRNGEFWANSLVANLYFCVFDGNTDSYGGEWPSMDYGLVAEEVSGRLALTELACFSTTLGAQGWKGVSIDIWMTCYAVVQNGYTFPTDPVARDFVCVGCFVLPWTGDCTGMLVA